MIEVKNLHKYFGELQVLRGIDETIKDGEVVCVIGPSGSGKSTFLRCLNLLEEPTEGKVIIDGECINKKNSQDVNELGAAERRDRNVLPGGKVPLAQPHPTDTLPRFSRFYTPSLPLVTIAIGRS